MPNTDLVQAQDALNIAKVNLASSVVKTSEDFDPSGIEGFYKNLQSYRSVINLSEYEPDKDSELWRYDYRYATGFRILNDEDYANEEEDDEITPLLVIEAEFIAVYFSKRKLQNEEIEAFAEDNVGYNVWPYWREYVQSTSSRLGVSRQLSVPLYTIPKGKD
jgi:hypothetical protein